MWADQRKKQGYKYDISLKRGIQLSNSLIQCKCTSYTMHNVLRILPVLAIIGLR